MGHISILSEGFKFVFLILGMFCFKTWLMGRKHLFYLFYFLRILTFRDWNWSRHLKLFPEVDWMINVLFLWVFMLQMFRLFLRGECFTKTHSRVIKVTSLIIRKHIITFVKKKQVENKNYTYVLKCKINLGWTDQ